MCVAECTHKYCYMHPKLSSLRMLKVIQARASAGFCQVFGSRGRYEEIFVPITVDIPASANEIKFFIPLSKTPHTTQMHLHNQTFPPP